MGSVLSKFAGCIAGVAAIVFSTASADLRAAGHSAADHRRSAAEGQKQPVRAERPQLGSSAAFSSDGVLHAVVKEGEHVVLYRSADAGASWGSAQLVNSVPEPISADGENRPKIAFAGDGAVLVSWTRSLAKRFSGEIRFARAAAGGAFSPPITVHQDRSEITHRFDSMLVTRSGQVVIAWIDKRDLEEARAVGREDYKGAAIYAAVSHDGGRSFEPERKVADHSCECCRIALAEDEHGRPLALWRHVFEPNERDHALAVLGNDDSPLRFERATFDRWRIDACPHHGPSLVVAADGTRHAVWFNEREGEGRVFYGRLADGRVEGQRTVGGQRAAHADIALAGARIAVVWKEFDGERTRLLAELSDDGGHSFHTQVLASTAGASDQPRVLSQGDALFVFWRTADEGMKGYAL